ncbi:E3 ubiquitin protein ligase TRIM56 [Echinococcus multilocularis]|uniref:E3 ubiquitin protein ligase TRIM56 n=1 Tax=Echinococcus multilocularis TaxID=6211 RepID=A0A068YFT4_ECHMU|nr:E3 ubiquitin protein ligase TRIM56 [Echinococcus multilocularis]
MEIRRSLEANFLTCRICNEPFTTPKVLACMHTFCKPCLEHVLEQETLEAARKRRELEQLQRSSGYSSTSSVSQYKGRWTRAFKTIDHQYDKSRLSDDSIQCPLCTKKTTLPSSGVHGLPDDQMAGKLACIVGRIPNYPVCDVCSSGIPVIYTDIALTDAPSSYSKPENHRPWTDAEDGDSTSDIQSTEDEDNHYRNGGLLHRGSLGNRSRSSRRHIRNGQKKMSMNASDDELFASSSSYKPTRPNEAVAACLECGKRLCDYCLKNHAKVAVTANHVIIQLDQLTQMSCSRHPREAKRFFCLTCGELVCLVCTFESSVSGLNCEGANEDFSHAAGHADHEVLSIRQGLINLEQNVNKSIFDCKQKAERLELLLLGLKSCASNVLSIKSAINAAAGNLINSIATQKENLLRELDMDVGVTLDQLTSQCETIAASLANWDEIKDEDDVMEAISTLHPVEALIEASHIREKYCNVLGELSASLPNQENWSQLIKEIETLEHNFSQQVNVKSKEDNGGNETGNETDSSSVTSNSPQKASKRVRFAPPAEAAGMIPPSYSAHWTRRLGKFIPGEGANLGRRATPGQLAAQAFANREKFACKAVQASPTDVNGRPLPAERDSRRHRAIQVDLRPTNQTETSMQTEACSANAIQRIRVDFGTQYQSSDVNMPLTFFRSSKQITVQK